MTRLWVSLVVVDHEDFGLLKNDANGSLKSWLGDRSGQCKKWMVEKR